MLIIVINMYVCIYIYIYMFMYMYIPEEPDLTPGRPSSMGAAETGANGIYPQLRFIHIHRLFRIQYTLL